jgi:hypothetical protein
MTLRRFHGPWNLTDLATVPKNGLHGLLLLPLRRGLNDGLQARRLPDAGRR